MHDRASTSLPASGTIRGSRCAAKATISSSTATTRAETATSSASTRRSPFRPILPSSPQEAPHANRRLRGLGMGLNALMTSALVPVPCRILVQTTEKDCSAQEKAPPKRGHLDAGAGYCLLRRDAARPTRPIPSKASVKGSGTGLGSTITPPSCSNPAYFTLS